jgi:hypothetical protein
MSSYYQCIQYCLTSNSDNTFGTSQHRKNMDTANRRIDRLKEEYEQQGYKVLINRHYNCGVDMILIVKKTGQIKKIIEATNYRFEWEYISDDKLGRYIDSLNYFDDLPNVEKELVISYDTNLREDQIRELGKNNISLRIEGRQD